MAQTPNALKPKLTPEPKTKSQSPEQKREQRVNSEPPRRSVRVDVLTFPTIVNAIWDRVDRDADNVVLLECLALLYTQQVSFGISASSSSSFSSF